MNVARVVEMKYEIAKSGRFFHGAAVVEASVADLQLQHCLRIWGKRAARVYSAHEVTCNFVGSVPFLQRHCQTLSYDFMVI